MQAKPHPKSSHPRRRGWHRRLSVRPVLRAESDVEKLPRAIFVLAQQQAEDERAAAEAAVTPRVLPTPGAVLAAVGGEKPIADEIKEAEEPEFHELLCYLRLFANTGQPQQSRLFEPLAQMITKAVVVDPGEWGPYVATPLTFVKAPSSPFAGLFDQPTLDANLDHIESKAIDANHWEPDWDWGEIGRAHV